MNTKILRIKELITLLNKACHAYYNLAKPIMTDKQYDALFDELKSLEAETGFILSISPTQRVGYEVISKLQKIKHSINLKSLDKIKNDIPALKKFIDVAECMLMLKADGLTVEHIYENGKHLQSSTRGDGEIGEDITHNSKTFLNLPLEIPFKGHLKIAGEAIIHIDDFEAINALLDEEDKYATIRNLASGSVRQLDSKICKERKIRFYAFNLLEAEGMNFTKKSEQLDWLVTLGFDIVPVWGMGKNIDINGLESIIEHCKLHAKIANFPIDGLVAVYNNLKFAESLGETTHHPLHSIAFKFEDEEMETILRSVEWQVGRTGVITPVGIFDTVIIDGTEVSRAGLHNVSIIEDLELGIGDIITVYKANMIIPQIEDNLTRSDSLTIPDKCPSCSSNTEIKINKSKINGETKITKVLLCSNDNCSAKLIQKLSHFVSREAMNIDGLSEATLEKLINKGIIRGFMGIYQLTLHKTQIVAMDGFGARSYEKLITAIENSKNVGMANFIYALGINQVGLSTAKALSKHFNYDFTEMMNKILAGYDLTQIEDIGDVTASSISDYFKNKDNLYDVIDLVNYFITIKAVEQKIVNKIFEGKTFVITGDVHIFKNRKELQEKIEELGGKASGSVSNKTSYLINNDNTSNSSKNKTAKDLGVPIITEEELIKMIK